ncbi:MAG: caspase family protein, partial [Campylobacterota bacterium]|nr:caspase family protein [Campylobacterota bacterium]
FLGCSNTQAPQIEKTPASNKNINNQLLKASKLGDIKQIKNLINNGADINYQNDDKAYALYSFVVDGYQKNRPNESLDLVKWMIEEKKADFHKLGYNGYSLIHVSKNLKLTQYLVELGLKIDSLTPNNATTLMGSLATRLDTRYEDTTLQKYLIEHCVDMEQKASFGTKKFSALDFAKKFNRSKAYQLINTSIENPPKQCEGKGILAPKISFYNTPETFDSEVVNISFKLEAQGFGIGDIVILVNGVEISDNKNRALKIKRGSLKVKTFNIKLQNGLNEIRAFAYDSSNIVKSEVVIHDVVAEYKVDREPKLYAIAIGIDQFEKESLNLRYAEADASLFGTTLFKRARGIFSEVKIIYLKKSDETTKEMILQNLKSLQDISANDFFVFYSATHGTMVDGKYYMITSNISSTEDAYIQKNAISEDELREVFKAIPTANKLLLFDTCYSGSINEKISKKLAESTVEKLNLTSMTAANSVQTALEGFADGHGIFTYVLSDALDGDADFNNDGIIQSMELVNYTNKMVPKEAKRFNHIQTPAYFQSGQVFNISKLRSHKGSVNMNPHYFKPDEVKKLVTYMDKNELNAFNKTLESNKVKTKLKVEKIKKEAAKIEAAKAAATLKLADKKFNFGRHDFVFNDNSIFLNIKDSIKKHFNFTDSKGRHLIVFDFYSKEPAQRVVTALDTQKVSDIYMADRGDWYRVTLQTKSRQGYEHITTKD